MNLDASMVITLFIAFLGAVGTVSMLIMNLSVRNAMGLLKLDIAKNITTLEREITSFRQGSTEKTAEVQLSIASMRLEFAKENSSLYQTITQTLQQSYANRKEVEQMHQANTQRLDSLEKRIQGIDERLPA